MIYTTTHFDGKQATDHTLLIGVGVETHKLAVVDQARQLKFAAAYEPANAEPEVSALLDLDFGTVKLAVSDSRYSLIPAEVYDEQQQGTYLSYLPFDGVGTAHVSDIASLGIKLLHQINRVEVEPFMGRFPDAGSYPLVQALLNAVAAHGMQADGPIVVAERHAPWITFGVFNRGRLVYCHDVEDNHVDDFSYHLLGVINQLGSDSGQPTVLLAGDVDQGDSRYERAAAYAQKVVLADSGALTGIHVPAEMAPYQHRFLSLLGLYPCES